MEKPLSIAYLTCIDNPNYAVTASGQVYCLYQEQTSKAGCLIRKRVNRLLKGSIDKDGYRTIRMVINGKKKHAKAHRLIAKAFIPNPENKTCINHKNNNRLDNRVENLEWCTPAENNAHMMAQGRQKLLKGDERKDTKIKSYDYVTIYAMNKHCGYSRSHLASMNNCSRQTIDKVINRVQLLMDAVYARYPSLAA